MESEAESEEMGTFWLRFRRFYDTPAYISDFWCSLGEALLPVRLQLRLKPAF